MCLEVHHLLLLKVGEGRLKTCFHCSFLCLCGTNHGRSSHLSFKWNNFAKVKDEECQLLCSGVCHWFALAWVVPGSLAGDPHYPASTMQRSGSAYCSGVLDLCLALVLGLTFFPSLCRGEGGSERVVGRRLVSSWWRVGSHLRPP